MKLISYISIPALIGLATVFAAGASGAAPTPVEAAPADTAAIDLKSGQSNDTVAAKEKIAQLTSQLDTLRHDLNLEREKVNELRRTNDTLEKVIAVAIPLAERNNESIRRYFGDDLLHINRRELDDLYGKLTSLSSYSGKFKAQADTIRIFTDVAAGYRTYTDFDTAPYGKVAIDSITDALMAIYETGAEILTDGQQEQINNLYIKVDGYRAGVEAFDNLIKAVDERLEPNRHDKSGDNICIIDRNEILAEEGSAQLMDKIKGYRYLASLLSQYLSQLDKEPRSCTPEIRAAIEAMLRNGAPGKEEPGV